MTIYNKSGYELKVLEKINGKEVFQFLSNYKIHKQMDIEERSQKRDGLKKQIVTEIDNNGHTPIGIYSGSKLIGICFTELKIDSPGVAKISYIKIDDDHIKTIGPHVLFNFLINILYKDIKIIFSYNIMDKFGNIEHKHPKILQVSTFRKDFSERLEKYFKDK